MFVCALKCIKEERKKLEATPEGIAAKAEGLYTVQVLSWSVQLKKLADMSDNVGFRPSKTETKEKIPEVAFSDKKQHREPSEHLARFKGPQENW